MNNFIKIIALLALVLITAQCGSQGKSAQVSMAVQPAQPIVILGDFVLGNVTILHPWYEFQVQVTNNSDTTVTVLGFQLNVTAMTLAGPTAPVQITIMPSGMNFTYTCSDSSTLDVTYTDFGEIPPATTKYLYLTYRGSLTGTCTQPPDITPAKLYAPGNPDMQNDHILNYNYQVAAEVLGWFGTYDNPIDRLDKTIYFGTQ
jgi:hypothetical protein